MRTVTSPTLYTNRDGSVGAAKRHGVHIIILYGVILVNITHSTKTLNGHIIGVYRKVWFYHGFGF